MNLPRPHAFTYPAQPLVLVVEGEELLRPYAADLLEAHEFAVLKAENADEALKVLEQRNDVRLLFTDIQMPGALDGMDLARQVHARWPRVLLVITSGQTAPIRAEIPDDGHSSPSLTGPRSSSARWTI